MLEGMLGSILEIFFLIIVFLLILVLAYVVTKKLALLRQGSLSHKNMKIIETLYLAPGQYLYIIKIGEKYHLFSGTKENIRYCAPIEEKDMILNTANEIPFSDYLKQLTLGKKEKNNENES